MMLTDEQFEALQRLQERLLEDALERGLAPSLADDAIAGISSRLALAAQIDALIGASFTDGDAAGDDDAVEDADDEEADLDDDAGLLDDDEPVRIARRLAGD